MKDCRYAKNLIEEWERMCRFERKYHSAKSNLQCSSECPMQKLKTKANANRENFNISGNKSCRMLIFDFDSDELVSVVQKWSDEHPVTTYRNKFLELPFIKSKFDDYGYPIVCAGDLFGFDCPFKAIKSNNKCLTSVDYQKQCHASWNMPYEDK